MSAFVAALQPYDVDQLNRVLGSGADDVIESGDAVADEHNFEAFVKAYEQSHHFENGPDDTITLAVGDKDWPLPIPIVRAGSGYRFDLKQGKDEILTRRIGCNELDSIQVCRAIIDAERDYFAMAHSDGGAYTAKFVSDPGTHDGLYWPAAEGEPDSPLGPMVADAAAQGYTSDDQSVGPHPYHGYVYRLLTEQGPSAPGGARSYMVDGRLKDGVAVVAYPVDYGNSGIMTFLVNQNGIVYQRDLGEQTAAIAESMTAFDPDENWRIVPP